MKQALLILLIHATFCLGIFSQNPNLYPHVDTKNEWKVLVSPHWPESMRHMRFYSYSEEEHLINGELYRNIQYKLEGSEILVSTRNFARQDGPKVWFTGIDDSEYLIADFTLNIDDTLLYEMDNAITVFPLRVYSIDTVVMMDGSERLSYHYYCDDELGKSNYIRSHSIQGVLNVTRLYGELFHCSLADDWNAGLIICYYEDGELIYSNPQYEECSVNSINPNLNTYDYTLSPNPGGDDLSIQVKNYSGRLDYSIFSTTGTILKEGQLISGETINTSNISPGMYFIMIRGIQGDAKILKWIRQNH
jgi:hypothetical protein